MKYNTSQRPLVISEYGRHVQNLVDLATHEKDVKKRQDMVEQIILLMELLNPQLKNISDYKHKLWDHLYTISGFKLECKSPYAKPSAADIYKKPLPLPYPGNIINRRHYGKNIETMITKCIAMEDNEKKQAYAKVIARFMKQTYLMYNKERVNDITILDDLQKMSEGKLSLPEDTVLKVVPVKHKPHRTNKHRRSRRKNYRR